MSSFYSNGVVSVKSCSHAGFCPDSLNYFSDIAKIEIIYETCKDSFKKIIILGLFLSTLDFTSEQVYCRILQVF